MKSRVKAFGHPIHPMLIVFPLGLLATSVIFDILYLIFEDATFATVSYWLIAAGVIGGLIAAIFGLTDWLSIPSGTRAKNIGLWHGLGNVIIVLLFAGSWLIRNGDEQNLPNTTALILSFAGAALAVVTGWLGGELVYRLRVGVDRGAHLDAPSSLSSAPASSTASGQGEFVPQTGRPEDEEHNH